MLRRVLGLGVLLLATGCQAPDFGWPHGITQQSHRSYVLWVGSCIAALAVGAFVWFLILFAAFRYRKRTDEMPPQVRYNLPVEALYTIVPFVIIGTLFFFTARDEVYLNKTTKNPQEVVNVVGVRWAWQFKYVSHAQGGNVPTVVGRPGQTPTLVLPTGRTIRFVETSQDVVHSFFVPQFLFKRDVYPGRINQFEVTINKTGTFKGRCTALCGTYHDQMLFTLKVVTPQEYDSYIADLSKSSGGGNAVTTSATGSTP